MGDSHYHLIIKVKSAYFNLYKLGLVSLEENNRYKKMVKSIINEAKNTYKELLKKNQNEHEINLGNYRKPKF